jgi:MarR-like DNA-binding transcriptional regulator SgrR of sgrS sRNA
VRGQGQDLHTFAVAVSTDRDQAIADATAIAYLRNAAPILLARMDADQVLEALANRDADVVRLEADRDNWRTGYSQAKAWHAEREEALLAQGARLQKEYALLQQEAAALYDEARYLRDMLRGDGLRVAGVIPPYTDNPYRKEMS